jgi:hypothetical protein
MNSAFRKFTAILLVVLLIQLHSLGRPAQSQKAEKPQLAQLVNRRYLDLLEEGMMFIELPVATAIFIIASLNLAYRPIWLIAILSALLLASFRAYLKWRYAIDIPFIVLLLAFAAVGIDTVGNHFRLYQLAAAPGPLPRAVASGCAESAAASGS